MKTDKGMLFLALNMLSVAAMCGAVYLLSVGVKEWWLFLLVSFCWRCTPDEDGSCE